MRLASLKVFDRNALVPAQEILSDGERVKPLSLFSYQVIRMVSSNFRAYPDACSLVGQAFQPVRHEPYPMAG